MCFGRSRTELTAALDSMRQALSIAALKAT